MGWGGQAKIKLKKERERNEYRDTQNKIKEKNKTQVAENQNSNVRTVIPNAMVKEKVSIMKGSHGNKKTDTISQHKAGEVEETAAFQIKGTSLLRENHCSAVSSNH